MKKRKLSLLIACAIATTSILSPLSFNSVSANTVEVIEMAEDKAEVSLIDLGYVNDKALTYTKYKNIKLNQNTDGLPIQLKLFGEAVQFEKGISAHAESSIVYDVEQYSKEFTHLRGYAGVDTRQAGRGDGVIFIVYTSKDGQQWEEKFRSGVQKGESECVILNVDVTGAKYVKVFANHNTYNGNDHAVYGNLRLVDASKDVQRGMVINGVKTVAEYDALLKSKGEATQVAESEKKLVYQRELVNRVGYDALNDLYYRNPEYREAIDYFFNNEQALAYYIEAGLPDGGSQPQVLSNFAKIYNKYASEIKADQEYLLKLAVSIALSHSKTVAFWTGTAKPQDPVKRYESFKYLAENVMDLEGEGNAEHFKSLCSALMQFTVNARLHEDEVIWLAEYAMSKKDSFSDKNPLNAYNYITYTGGYNYNESQYYDATQKSKWEEKYNLGRLDDDYGNPDIERNFMVFEEGGVCGALAKTYTNLSEVFGKPAQVVHQPGHAAVIRYELNAQGQPIWTVPNDVFGIAQSRDEMGQMPLTWGMQSWNSDRSAPYITLIQEVLNDYDDYAKTVRLNIMADVYEGDNAKQEAIYEKALEIQKLQLDSIYNLINVYKKDTTKQSSFYLELAKKIATDYKYHPLAMRDLLKLIEGKIDEKDLARFNIVKNRALVDASKVTDAEFIQANVTRASANYILDNMKERNSFATVSLENKEIVINPKYANKEHILYSLDGKNHLLSASNTIKLTDNQIALLTDANDLLVGIRDFDVMDRIEIVKQGKPSIQANDLEDTIVGTLNYLEWSEDGKVWQDYKEGTKFTGERTIQARYKANGNKLPSDIITLKFTESKDSANKKYVPLSNFDVLSVSSEQSEGMVKNLFDGNSGTHFHTSNNGDNERAIILELKESKFVNTMVYESYTQQGRVVQFEVYGSADGNTWVLMDDTEFKEQTTIEIPLSKPMEVKFIKLVAKKTLAKDYVPANTDKFFSGKGIYFYEDSTQPSVINDNVVSANSTIKKAILDEKAKIEEENKKEEETTEVKEEAVEETKVKVNYTASEDGKSVVANLETIAGTVTFVKEGETDTVTLTKEKPSHNFQYQNSKKQNVSTSASITWLSEAQRLEGDWGRIIFTRPNIQGVKLGGNVDVVLAVGDNVEIMNNKGSNTFVFTENGTFVFQLKNRTTGEIKVVPISVDWIYS